MQVANTHTKEAPHLGQGIYLTSDISEILKLPYHKVQYMIKSFWHGATFGDKKNSAVNFFALIEFYTYYHLRENGFTSSEIKKFHSQLSKEFDTPYPFAFFKIKSPIEKTKKSKIWYEHSGLLIRGDGSNQIHIEHFIEPFLKKIEFGNNALAKRFFPIAGTTNVVVDPLHQFGQPVINGTNLQIKTINRLYLVGETKENICILHDISMEQVDDAIRYYTETAA